MPKTKEMTALETKLFSASSKLGIFCGRENVKVSWFCVDRQKPVAASDESIGIGTKKHFKQFFSKEEGHKLDALIFYIRHCEVDIEEINHSHDNPNPGIEESDKPFTYLEVPVTGIRGFPFPFRVWGKCDLSKHPLTEESEKKVDEMASFMFQKETGPLGLNHADALEALDKKISIVCNLYDVCKKKAITALEYTKGEEEYIKHLIKVHVNRISMPM